MLLVCLQCGWYYSEWKWQYHFWHSILSISLPLNKFSSTMLVIMLRYKTLGQYWYWYWYWPFGKTSIGIGYWPQALWSIGIGIGYCPWHSEGIGIGIDLLQTDIADLCYPTSKMAEIWPPGIFFQYICTCKVSASYRLNSQTCISESSRIVWNWVVLHIQFLNRTPNV